MLIYQQLGTDNPRVVLTDTSVNPDFDRLEIVAGELLRITLSNGTETIRNSRLTARLLNKGQLLVQSQVDIPVARWLPLKVKNITTSPLILEFLFYDLKNRNLIDRKTVEVKIVAKNL